jgi:hypothetical protein
LISIEREKTPAKSLRSGDMLFEYCTAKMFTYARIGTIAGSRRAILVP